MTTMTTSESKMKELYELIDSTHSLMSELIHDDFDISPPNEDEDDWYICLEQKIIRIVLSSKLDENSMLLKKIIHVLYLYNM